MQKSIAITRRSGSPTAPATNDCVAAVASVKYFPFGVCRNSQGTLDTDKLFTGQRLDDTGLYYYNARYYDATIGRFISADTIVQDYTNPQTLNRYSYCLNNPLKYIDPSGHEGWFADWWDGFTDWCSDALETIKGWSQACRDLLDWLLDEDKSFSDRLEDVEAETAWWWENRDWAISSAADIGITVMGGYGVAAFGKSFIKGAMARGVGGGEDIAKFGGRRIFYTGGSRAEQAAMDAANMGEGATIGMTTTGQRLAAMQAAQGWEATQPYWRTASGIWARGAKGEVDVYINYLQYRTTSIWATIEEPILKANGLKINYIDVTPWKW